MPALSQKRRAASAKVGGLARHRDSNDPDLTDARRDLRAAELEEHVRRIVDQAPALTAEQRTKVAALLRPRPTHSPGGSTT